MGAVAGAVLGAPISTILIIFELTSNFTLTIAVMVGVVIATVITQQTVGGSFFIRQLARRGLSLEGGREINLLANQRVRDIMSTDHEVVPPDLDLPALRAKLCAAPHNELFVVDGDGRLAGTIALVEFLEVAFDPSVDVLVRAADVLRGKPPVLAAGADLHAALRLVESTDEAQIAVVEDTETMKLVGYVREHDVMQAYNRAVMQARAEERGEV
jgi:CIC family chloride channel protein